MPLWPTSKAVGIPYLHNPKEVMWVDLNNKVYNPRTQVYSFTPAGATTMHIHIGKLMDMVEDAPDLYPIVRVHVTAGTAKVIRENNSIDLTHCVTASHAWLLAGLC